MTLTSGVLIDKNTLTKVWYMNLTAVYSSSSHFLTFAKSAVSGTPANKSNNKLTHN